MKKKKNIIKKINTNKFKFRFKKGFKHFFKRIHYKFKRYKKLSYYLKSLYRLKNAIKSFKYYNLNINKNLIKNRFNYFNYISNGLDLKYNNSFQDLSNIDYLAQFDKKKSIIVKQNEVDIIKHQKFLNFLDKNYFFQKKIIFNEFEVSQSQHYIYFLYLINIYRLNCLLILIN